MSIKENGFIEYEGWNALMHDETIGQRVVLCSDCKASILIDDAYDSGEIVIDGKFYFKPYCKKCWEKVRPRATCARCYITEDDPRCEQCPWYPIAYNDDHLFRGSICKRCILSLIEKCWCDHCVLRKLESQDFSKYFKRDVVLDYVRELRSLKP